MGRIEVSRLTFSYEGSYDNVFEDVSFTLDTDWKLGFTGRNGRGKTTFLKLLLGRYEYRGSIFASEEFEYFPFEADETLTPEKLAESEDPEFELWRFERETNLLGLSEDALSRPYSTLSSGEKTKVQLAVLFSKQNRFLLIDEPTNHLDSEGRKLIGEYLGSKSGFILVSHDRKLLDACCDHILSINRTNVEVTKGNFSVWYENKLRRDASEFAENEKLGKEIDRLNASAKQTAEWSDEVEESKIGNGPCDRGYVGAKSAKMMKRSKTAERRKTDAAQEKSKLLKNVEKPRELKLSPIPYRAERLAECRDFGAVYGGKVCGRVSFEIRRGDRIALAGSNGCGKSSVLKNIVGIRTDTVGTLSVGSGLTVSYVPQNSDFLSGKPSDYAKECGVDESLFFAILRKLDFARVQFEKNMEEYSAGQKKKILLARSLCEKANLYVWDEPLNYIDVISRIQIENLLTDFPPTLLFVEHDEAFLEKIATKTVRFMD